MALPQGMMTCAVAGGWGAGHENCGMRGGGSAKWPLRAQRGLRQPGIRSGGAPLRRSASLDAGCVCYLCKPACSLLPQHFRQLHLHMLSDPVLQLLEDAELGPSSRLSLAGVKESFCLEFSELHDVPHEETTNPRGEHFAAMKLYDAPLVAERALEVFGDLEKAKMGIRARRVVADAVAARRADVVADMAQRSAEAARRTVARTAPERLCVSLDIAPQTSITQSKAMETFHLEKHHLFGVAHQTRVGAARQHAAVWALCRLWHHQLGPPASAGLRVEPFAAIATFRCSKGRPPNRGTTNQLPLPCCACPALPAVLRCAAQPSQPSLEPHEALQGC